MPFDLCTCSWLLPSPSASEVLRSLPSLTECTATECHEPLELVAPPPPAHAAFGFLALGTALLALAIGARMRRAVCDAPKASAL